MSDVQEAEGSGVAALRRQVLPLLWRQRLPLAIGLLTLVVVDVIQLMAPRLTGSAVDAMAAGAELWPILGLLLVVGLAVAALRWLWRICFVGASRRVRRDLRQRLYEQVLALGPEARGRYTSGDVITRATADVDAVGMACGFGVLAACDALVMIILVSTRVPAVGGAEVVWALLPLPLMAFWVLWAGRQVHRRFAAVQASNSAVSEEARELLSAARYVKGSGRSEDLAHGFVAANQRQRQDALSLARINAWFDPMIMSLAALAQAILLWQVGQQVISGALPLGAVVELAGYVALLTWPAMAIGWSVNLLQRGAVAAQRIALVIEEPPAIPDPEQPQQLPASDVLAVSNLYLRLAEVSVLRGLSFHLHPGEMVGVVGPSGAGKSTLLRCLARLQPVPAGTLSYGGVTAEALRAHDFRGLFALAAQEPVLFAGTVRDNIALADPALDQESVVAAARAAGIHEEILALPQGYDSLLGERGLTLSGGQRARLGLARALAEPTPFLLLDDCLAAVDGDRAAQVVAGLRLAVGRRAALVVAHRLATVATCDRIIVLEEGRISEEGSHHALLAAGGHYARIWALQHGQASTALGGAEDD